MSPNSLLVDVDVDVVVVVTVNFGLLGRLIRISIL